MNRENEISEFSLKYQNYFNVNAWYAILAYLQTCDDDSFKRVINSASFIKPNTLVMHAIFLGLFGVDRFVVGDIGLGVVKVLTLGQFLIGYVVDILTAEKRALEYNYEVFTSLRFRIPL